MYFPWDKYEEKELSRRNTLQVFITNRCNLKCDGCFARNVMINDDEISVTEYWEAIKTFARKGGEQINLLGGEPLLHSDLKMILSMNEDRGFKTTIYTNGLLLNKWEDAYLSFEGVKIRVSLYSMEGNTKAVNLIPETRALIDANFMVSKNTTVDEMLESAYYMEKNFRCNVFFIFSLLELENDGQEFFTPPSNGLNSLEYKKLVHEFLIRYEGNLDIHISKRGVFESTKTLPDNKCRFANYFIGGKIIQCPYDVVNTKYQKDYDFGCRNCQHNNTCLMSKIVLKRKYKK